MNGHAESGMAICGHGYTQLQYPPKLSPYGYIIGTMCVLCVCLFIPSITGYFGRKCREFTVFKITNTTCQIINNEDHRDSHGPSLNELVPSGVDVDESPCLHLIGICFTFVLHFD